MTHHPPRHFAKETTHNSQQRDKKSVPFRPFALAVALILTLGTWTTASFADPTTSSVETPYLEWDEAPSRKWYGWQNLIVDGSVHGLGLGVGMLLANHDDRLGAAAVATGMAGYAFGGPIVHIAHKNYVIGLASFGLRVTLPPLGVLVGYYLERGLVDCTPGDFSFCGLGGAVIGGLVGTASAIGLDAGLLAYETEGKSDRARGLAQDSLSLLPHVSPQGGGLWLNGTF